VWWHITVIPAPGIQPEAGRSCNWGQPGLHSEFKVSLGYVARPCLKKTRTKVWIHKMEGPGAVAQACIPSYSRGRDCEDHNSRTAWVKKSSKRLHLNQRLDIMVCICDPSYVESINRRIMVKAGQGTK
jgi:hypothetical protein